MAEIDWKREFDGLGSRGVRAAQMSARWDKAKRSAAREWLERSDATQWQATRPKSAAAEAEDAGSSLSTFRRYNWVYYVAGGALGLLGMAQMFRL
jgi:hypothetical protein